MIFNSKVDKHILYACHASQVRETWTSQLFQDGYQQSAVSLTCPEWSLKSSLQKPVSELCVLYQNSIRHSFHHWSAELGPQTADQLEMLESLLGLTGQIYPAKEGGMVETGCSSLNVKANHWIRSPLVFYSCVIPTKWTKGEEFSKSLRHIFEISVSL